MGHIDLKKLSDIGVDTASLLRHWIFITEYQYNILNQNEIEESQSHCANTIRYEVDSAQNTASEAEFKSDNFDRAETLKKGVSVIDLSGLVSANYNLMDFR